MATIQSMTVALDADISGLRQGLQQAENRVEQFHSSVDTNLAQIQADFRVRGRSSGGGWASSAVGAMVRGIGSAASAVGGALAQSMKNPVVMSAVIGGAAALGLAAAGAFTIALAGAGLVGISAYILKDVPKIKSAFKELKKTAKDVFKGAAKPMVEPIETAIDDIKVSLLRLKPDFKELFQSVADSGATKNLTDGLHGMLEEIVHGLTDMMNKAKPVFEGLEYFMKKVGEGIGGFFREIGKAGPEAEIVLRDLGDIIKEFLIFAGKVIAFFVKLRARVLAVQEALSMVWDLITGKLDAMKRAVGAAIGLVVDKFKKLPEKILGALGRYVKNVKDNFRKARDKAVEMVSTMIRRAIDIFIGTPLRAYNALKDLGSKLKDRALSAGRKLVDAIKNKVGDAVDKVRDFPGKAKDALWNIGSKLYQSGRDLIWGFIDGIKSMAGEIWDAAWNVVDSVSGLFPNSPAKEGPFSGKGWTPHRGKALIDGFRKGMHSAMPAMRKELDNMYGAVPDMRADVSGVIRAGRSKGPVLTVNMTGAPEWLKQGIREIVRTDGGGDVQFTFGR